MRGDAAWRGQPDLFAGRGNVAERPAQVAHALSDDEVERRKLSKALLPHVQAFYANYYDSDAHVPFYSPSSRL